MIYQTLRLSESNSHHNNTYLQRLQKLQSLRNWSQITKVMKASLSAIKNLEMFSILQLSETNLHYKIESFHSSIEVGEELPRYQGDI